MILCGDHAVKKLSFKNFYCISLLLNDHGIAYFDKYSAVFFENLVECAILAKSQSHFIFAMTVTNDIWYV